MKRKTELKVVVMNPPTKEEADKKIEELEKVLQQFYN